MAILSSCSSLRDNWGSRLVGAIIAIVIAICAYRGTSRMPGGNKPNNLDEGRKRP
jgi:hypothetical protein